MGDLRYLTHSYVLPEHRGRGGSCGTALVLYSFLPEQALVPSYLHRHTLVGVI